MKKAVKSSARASENASKPYWEMTTAELREATKEFDREFMGDTFGPPTAEQRPRIVALVANGAGRATAWGPRRSPSQSRNACWPKRIGLPKKLHVPRAALIARGLQAVVSEEVPIG